MKRLARVVRCVAFGAHMPEEPLRCTLTASSSLPVSSV